MTSDIRSLEQEVAKAFFLIGDHYDEERDPIITVKAIYPSVSSSGRFTFGDSPENDIVLRGKAAGQQAAVLWTPDSGYALERHSAGISINGQNLETDRMPIKPNDSISFGDRHSSYSLVDSAGLQAEWEKLLARRDMRPFNLDDTWSFSEQKAAAETYTGWKIHVYAHTEEDVYNIFRAISVNSLEYSRVEFKTVKELERVTRGNGKAFTIYIDHKGMPGFRQMLDYLRKEHPAAVEGAERVAVEEVGKRAREIVDWLEEDLESHAVRGARIEGDMPVPGTKSGRLFYRYDQNLPMLSSREKTYVPAGQAHNIAENPDIFSR